MPKKTQKVVEESIEVLPFSEMPKEEPEPEVVVEEVATTEQATEEEATETQPPKEVSKPKRKPRKKPSDIVQVKVLNGSVGYGDADGSVSWFEVGEVFSCSREQAESFDQRHIEILE